MLCLTAGYGIAGQWIGAAIAIITGLAWLLARKYPASGLPFICLVVSVCLAVVGQLSGSPPLLMICGSGFALAVWDLIFLDDALGSNSSEEQTRQYESKHLQSLALALGFGLLIAFLGRLLNLQDPFFSGDAFCCPNHFWAGPRLWLYQETKYAHSRRMILSRAMFTT